MVKMHTQMKRKRGLTHNLGHTKLNVPKKKGAKTFASAESANAWAKENKITKFELKSVKKNKRFEIVTS